MFKTIPIVADCELDVCGYQCPLPVIKAAKSLATMESHKILALIATDPLTEIDIPHFCAEHGHALLYQGREADYFIFLIRKGLSRETGES